MRHNSSPRQDLAALVQDLKGKARNVETNREASQARRSLTSFLEYAIPGDDGTGICADLCSQVIATAFVECLKTGRHLSLTSPPGLGKSTIARAGIVWTIGRTPSITTVSASVTADAAKPSVSYCRSLLMGQAFREVFPEVEPDLTRGQDTRGLSRGFGMSKWFVRTKGLVNDPTMQAMSITPSQESIRCGVLLVDDAVTESNCRGAELEKVWNAFQTTWLDGRLSNGGWCCYLQNVRTTNDPLHRLLHSSRFCSVWLHVHPDNNKMVLSIWNAPPALMRRLAELEHDGQRLTPADGSAHFRPTKPENHFVLPLPDRPGYSPSELAMRDPASLRRLYHGRGMKPEDQIWPSFMSRAIENHTAASMLGLPTYGGSMLPVLPIEHRHRFSIAIGVDLAGRQRKGNAFWVLALDSNGFIIPVLHEIHRTGMTEFFRRIHWVTSELGWRPHITVVESNGIQESVINLAVSIGQIRDWDFVSTIQAFNTGANKMSGQMSLPSLDADFATNRVRWPGMEAGLRPDWKVFETEAADLTLDTVQAATYDGIMAYWFARVGLAQLSNPAQRQAGLRIITRS